MTGVVSRTGLGVAVASPANWTVVARGVGASTGASAGGGASVGSGAAGWGRLVAGASGAPVGVLTEAAGKGVAAGRTTGGAVGWMPGAGVPAGSEAGVFVNCRVAVGAGVLVRTMPAVGAPRAAVGCLVAVRVAVGVGVGVGVPAGTSTTAETWPNSTDDPLLVISFSW